VDPALAYVRGATPNEVATVWRTCQPWPWLLVGTTPTLPHGLPELLGTHPIPVQWVGRPPDGLPATVHADWMALAAALEELTVLTRRGAGGVRLLRNRGLQLPDGRIVLDAANVEGLLAAPAGLPLPHEDALQQEIAANALPLRLERAGDLLRLAYPPDL
jgi:hypothetical protein